MCTAYLNLFESLYERCINVHIKGSVNGIETETDQKVCGHVAPNTTGKIHRSVLTERNITGTSKKQNMMLVWENNQQEVDLFLLVLLHK